MPTDPFKRATINLKGKVEWKPVADWLARKAREAPDKAERVMRRVAAWWHRQALPHIPVRASRSLAQKRGGMKGERYSRAGRGQLKKRTQAFVTRRWGTIVGGVVSGTNYAVWLAAGTRFIAGGRVMRWRPGDSTIKTWPAKQENPAAGYRAELPIILPWHGAARDMFVRELKEKL